MTTPYFEPKTIRRGPRNPYELALGLGACAAILVGVIVSVAATMTYNQAATIAGYSNSLPDGGALGWAALGTQLWQLGILVLVGMTFYWMVQWNKARSS